MSEFADAVKIVVKNIKNDETIAMGYRANIAMAFYDEAVRYKKEHKKENLSNDEIHLIANRAAKNFLTLWCAGV